MKSDDGSSDYLLTVRDRCDACQAQAYVYVQLESGELLFCLHHWSVNKDILSEMAVDIINETERLLTK